MTIINEFSLWKASVFEAQVISVIIRWTASPGFSQPPIVSFPLTPVLIVSVVLIISRNKRMCLHIHDLYTKADPCTYPSNTVTLNIKKEEFLFIYDIGLH